MSYISVVSLLPRYGHKGGIVIMKRWHLLSNSESWLNCAQGASPGAHLLQSLPNQSKISPDAYPHFQTATSVSFSSVWLRCE